MDDRELTVRSRQLGLALARARHAKGLSARQLAHELGWSDSTLSRVLSGKRGVSPLNLAALLARCGVTGAARDALLTLARDASEPGWCQEHGERLPVDLTTLRDLEDIAVSLTCFDVVTVPTLLQTEDYRRSLLRANPVIPDEEINDRIAHHQKRQHVLDRDNRVNFRFFLDDHILTHTGPGRGIMSDQVHHLLRMAVRPRVEIRVVPAGCALLGACPPFQLMTFTELHPVIYLEHLNATAFLEQHATVAGYRRILTELDKVALNGERSRSWLATLAAALAESPDHFRHPERGV